ncbi:hypothetical protein [Solidesulfovibrio magneticus]|uniref:Uncharacterized protein n=1 Tax=Solidesulfovibrio magneticus (strain ATCC 700980 / DSM 13731 / RS-1) TaxID=573370 RepID=C4XGP4_SOLM1|nr:hypothetical protein [Solidesulfovibrio magneticus]BAH76202.1 hypothetical protein DMR_27110 [Solidesulfovibrio magneticus RS-1]
MRHAFLPRLLAVSIALSPWAIPALTLAQDYRPNTALGELLAHMPYVKSGTNPGGKNVLENSCIYKDSFSISPSKEVLERCDVAGAVAEFTAKNGPPDLVSEAPGGKKLLEYRLLHGGNSYFVKIYVACAGGKTEIFAIAECKEEKNRVKPGPPKDDRSFWKKMLP